MQVVDRTFRFSRRMEMAAVFEQVTKVPSCFYGTSHCISTTTLRLIASLSSTNTWFLPAPSPAACFASPKASSTRERASSLQLHHHSPVQLPAFSIILPTHSPFFAGDTIVVDGSSQLPLQQWLDSSAPRAYWPNQYPH
jgi:hypothetical protein